MIEMKNSWTNLFRNVVLMLLPLTVLAGAGCSTSANGQVPAYAGPANVSATEGKQTAVLAGGCFWGVDAVFKHVKGVESVVSGYSGGDAATAEYETVSSGSTGHAESVKITYDPSQVRFSELLRIFFSVATDPTQLNRQGPDVGPQYRSAIFYTNDEQKQIAQSYIQQLDEAGVFGRPIVTQVVPFKAFYAAEAYHQNFLERHPNYPYIVFNDLPKLKALKKKFPDIYKK
jgi:peptide-methionine (S)-S-oxide reductase